MATSNKPQVAKQEAIPEVDPYADQVIEYVGEGAENVKFERDPRCKKYVVRADGTIMGTY